MDGGDDIHAVAVEAHGAGNFVFADVDFAELGGVREVGCVEVFEVRVAVVPGWPYVGPPVSLHGGDDAQHAVALVELELIIHAARHRHGTAGSHGAIGGADIDKMDVRFVPARGAGRVVVIWLRDHEAPVARLDRAGPVVACARKRHCVAHDRRGGRREIVARHFQVRAPAPVPVIQARHRLRHDQRRADEAAIIDPPSKRNTRHHARLTRAYVADEQFAALVHLVKRRRAARPAEFFWRALDEQNVRRIKLVKVFADAGHPQRPAQGGRGGVGHIYILKPAILVVKIQMIAIEHPDVTLGHRPRWGCAVFRRVGEIHRRAPRKRGHHPRTRPERQISPRLRDDLLAEEVRRPCVKRTRQRARLPPEDAKRTLRDTRAHREDDILCLPVQGAGGNGRPRLLSLRRLPLERHLPKTRRHSHPHLAARDDGDHGFRIRRDAVAEVAPTHRRQREQRRDGGGENAGPEGL